ncbi:MAG TPA: LPXTG cell wall anchor domain-containing protein [Flavisolibacter sp.]|nr:LPXTG cell wall anchor domain-containing protein [Flavisolibacter sp.]
MANKDNGALQKLAVNKDNKNAWLKAAGAIALMATGLILYRKRQRMIGGALISGSVKLLTGMAG